jgi:diguanylate cyclase (GGDEF)-like protein/PAS domain S-box-containing protein
MNKTGSLMAALLEDPHALLLGLCNNTLFGVCVIQDGRFIYVNQYLCTLFGETPETLCSGVGPVDIAIDEDKPRVQATLDHYLKGIRRSGSCHFRAQRKDDTIFDIEIYGSVTLLAEKPTVIGIVHDISQKVAATRAQQDQLSFISRLIETIPNPVFYKDEQGRYMGCNAAFEHYIGKERDSLIGCTVYDISPKDLADVYYAADKTLFDNPGTQVYEANVSYADGSRHNVVFYKAAFNKSDGTLGGLVGIILDITDRKQLEDKIWHEAHYDALTGLPNRRLLQLRLMDELERAQRYQHKLFLLFIDLDGFKMVNDTLGHNIGDQLLVCAADRICQVVRSSDIVARQGGDEFLVILPEMTDAISSGFVASKIIESLKQPYELAGNIVHISATIGIACFPDDAREMETLIRYADQAMYAAKSRGRSCFCLFDNAMEAKMLRRLEIDNDLRNAIRNQQFEVYYQPIIDMNSGQTVKAEALIRWHHPTRGMVNPAEFIPIGEEVGLIGEIGDWVLHQATLALQQWHQLALYYHEEQPLYQISVNISPRQFTPETSRRWISELRHLGIPTQSLVVEITEGILLDERSDVITTLDLFRRAGAKISIDDFGTGYSAMAYLKKFDIDYLKIDRSFVHDLLPGSRTLLITESMITMAHKLGIQVIAEGVETLAQYQMLLDAGCDYAQGFLFAKPMPLENFLHFAIPRE